MSEEWKEGSYQHPFEDCLLKAIEQWRSGRCASWSNALGDDEIVENCECLSSCIEPLDKQEIFKAIEDFARRILESRPGVGHSGPLSDGAADREWYYDCPAFIEWTKESLKIHLMGPLVAKLQEAASRLVRLSEWEMFLIEGIKLSKSAREFWRLVQDSYILDLSGPCIAFCRSAIEDALRDKIDDETYEKHLRRRSAQQSEFSLADKIAVARLEGLISDDLAKEANKIRIIANKVLHTDPRLTGKTEESISQTVRILCMIETGKDPWHVEP